MVKKIKSRMCREILATSVSLMALIGFVIMGAFMFQYTERFGEDIDCQIGESKQKSEIRKYRDKVYSEIYYYFNAPYAPPKFLDKYIGNNRTINDTIDDLLRKLRDTFLNIGSEYKYYRQNCKQDTLWNFGSSFLYVLSLVTTIGYGHVATRSASGQIICICYSCIGIPLTLIVLSNLGKLIGIGFQDLYHVYKAYRFKKKYPPHLYDLHGPVRDYINDKQIPIYIPIGCFIFYMIIGGILFHSHENWSLMTSFYFSFITLSTIGFGDFVPGINELQDANKANSYVTSRSFIVIITYILFGLALFAVVLNLIKDVITDFIKKIVAIFKEGQLKGFSFVREQIADLILPKRIKRENITIDEEEETALNGEFENK